LDKEINFIINHNIHGLKFLLKSKELRYSKPVKENVLVKEKLKDFNGYFGFEYQPIDSNITLNVDILA
jgi:hypothetical protein